MRLAKHEAHASERVFRTPVDKVTRNIAAITGADLHALEHAQ
ncbi:MULTISPECIES: hypothetical protein [unclassified Sinorhizobium]|nr:MULTISPECIES: hypothetical protein [unclassified Sinorhizobium]MDK1376259.1 hypothetical protein [Sinorhizobium sp. 6-70]MDK1482181.1 hypothetical protein [Sinorhizobium sp. 6-117]